jgi:hypothetical protein
MLKAQSYLLAGPLPVEGSEVPAAGAGGSGANPMSEPSATVRASAAAVIPANMAETLACRWSRRYENGYVVRRGSGWSLGIENALPFGNTRLLTWN